MSPEQEPQHELYNPRNFFRFLDYAHHMQYEPLLLEEPRNRVKGELNEIIRATSSIGIGEFVIFLSFELKETDGTVHAMNAATDFSYAHDSEGIILIQQRQITVQHTPGPAGDISGLERFEGVPRIDIDTSEIDWSAVEVIGDFTH